MIGREFLNVEGRRIAVVRSLADAEHIVVMCHGLHSNLGGDHFDVLQTRLGALNIGVLRFDQYGNGRSEGLPIERRFRDWVSLTLHLVHWLHADGHRVSVLGNSIGGSTALVTASIERRLHRCVAWVPGLGTVPQRQPGERDFIERGERMEWEFWQQYQEVDVIERLRRLSVPTLVLLATEDEHEDSRTRAAAMAAQGPNLSVEWLVGFTHGRWNDGQAMSVVARTTAFLSGS